MYGCQSRHDAFEGSNNTGLTGVVDPSELYTLCEPISIGKFYGFLLRSRQGAAQPGGIVCEKFVDEGGTKSVRTDNGGGGSSRWEMRARMKPVRVQIIS